MAQRQHQGYSYYQVEVSKFREDTGEDMPMKDSNEEMKSAYDKDISLSSGNQGLTQIQSHYLEYNQEPTGKIYPQ